mmetsp:Transcript_8101/g.20087  ORF Transcript_8101/g.20087 Transcript_8101/m.20087 type:complete len:465 (+) Transcript_8101:173-1567(+)|eukprot:CAMPEP_0172392476 /NCGR_PEP_ID=MMETSP1061-20121228/8595_1 /TAXON_ID=37318 /ORGANISM="Pseudo-nitzschia pungens, Strain cf. pungens" /LENGTH=464 /DNA_ID=CAMNT_0013123325 /DNA_START=153 /DNA_END=1547 /DNA_ORIENTATION=+
MGEPVVVQGTVIAAPAVSYGGATETTTDRQPAKTGCKDPIFAVLFYINVIAMFAVVGAYGVEAMDGVDASNYTSYVAAAAVFGIVSMGAALAGLFMLMTCPALIIKFGLIFSLAVALFFTVYAFFYLNFIYGIFALIFLLLTVCYVKAVWSRIPFAAINMLTAGTAIKANLGVTFFALFFTVLEISWIIVWSVALVGVYDVTVVCDDADGTCDINYGYLFLLFLSLYFTQQVLQSCVHVTVAGTVATWWVAPDESGCCSKAVCNSFIRTVTTSFGSVCFGSLLVAIIQALRSIANSARNNDDAAILACIAECILGCIQSIVEYFNKWAYVYVGVYGFSYIEAGKAVMQLFKDRGWEAIIADDLVGGAITLLSVVLGLIVGSVGVAYAAADDNFANLAGNNSGAAFGIGFIAGFFVCLVLLSTVSSGVNTVIVMFADAPQEFQTNHPELSMKMREKWGEFYPGSI